MSTGHIIIRSFTESVMSRMLSLSELSSPVVQLVLSIVRSLSVRVMSTRCA